PARVHDRRAVRREGSASDRQPPGSGEDRGGGRAEDDDARRALGGVHHARTEAGAVRLRRVPGPGVQAVPGRKAARRARRIRQAAEAVRLDPRDRLSFGERALRRGAPQLARSEAGAATEEIAPEHLSTGAIVLIDKYRLPR